MAKNENSDGRYTDAVTSWVQGRGKQRKPPSNPSAFDTRVPYTGMFDGYEVVFASELPPREQQALADLFSTYFSESVGVAGRKEGFVEYPSAEVRENVYTIGKTFGDYVHDNNIGAMIYPDVGARLLAHATNAYFRKAYPRTRPPETYFVNAESLTTREDIVTDTRRLWNEAVGGNTPFPSELSQAPDELTPIKIFDAFSPLNQKAIDKVTEFASTEELLALIKGKGTIGSKAARLLVVMRERGMRDSEVVDLIWSKKIAEVVHQGELSNNLGEKIAMAPVRADTVAAFQNTFPGLMKDTDRSVMITDTCVHSGRTLRPLTATLRHSGFVDTKVGLVSASQNRSEFTPDMTVFAAADCYPLGKDPLIERTPDRIISSAVTPTRQLPDAHIFSLLGVSRESGVRKREEIRRVFNEHV